MYSKGAESFRRRGTKTKWKETKEFAGPLPPRGSLRAELEATIQFPREREKKSGPQTGKTKEDKGDAEGEEGVGIRLSDPTTRKRIPPLPPLHPSFKDLINADVTSCRP